MRDIAIVPLVAAAALGISIGLKYMLATAFMSYHATVAGRPWAQIDPGMQAIVLGMLRIIGGGFATTGVATLWLCVAIHEGARWAPWAILTIAAVSLLPTLLVALRLRAYQPSAKTPVVPTLAALALIIIGAGLSIHALA